MPVVVLACVYVVAAAPVVPADDDPQAQHMRDLVEAPVLSAKKDGAADETPPRRSFSTDQYVADLARLPEDPGTFEVLVENDIIFTIDRHYTAGDGGIYTTSRGGTPNFMRRIGQLFASDGEVHAQFGLAQNIYTPRSIILTYLDDRDRPFAGFLYAIAGTQTVTPRHLDSLTLTLGVVGPASLAEQTQKLIHIALGPTPLRWDTQLRNEPAGILAYQRTWRMQLGMVARLQGELYPHLGFAAGNVFDYGAAGMTIRFGDHMPLDYGPSRILPGIQGSGVFNQPNTFGWYWFFGGELRGLARNIFLDGNTFVDSRRVPKIPVVGDLQFGYAFVWPGFRISMTHVLRSKEFDKQTKPDYFGSLDLAFHI